MVTDFPYLRRQAGRRRLLRRSLRALARAYTENALVIIACSDVMVSPLALRDLRQEVTRHAGQGDSPR